MPSVPLPADRMEKVLEGVMSLEKGLGRGLWRTLQQSELSVDKVAKISQTRHLASV